MLQQGEFYDLPIISILDEPEGSYYIVQSEGQDYKVKMYNFQRNDIEQRQRKILPCHVRECTALLRSVAGSRQKIPCPCH